jgi:hypothetical protein
MLAVCKKCGLVFNSNIISGGPNTTITISNVGTNCPRCNGDATILDGTFNFDSNGNVNLVSGPPLTRKIVSAIKTLVEKAKKESFTKEKFIEEANKISPEAGNYLAKFVPKNFGDIMAFFMFILGILAYIESRQSKPETINNIKVENNYSEKVRQPKSVSESMKKAKPRAHKKRKR